MKVNFLLTLPYFTQKLEHATWNDHFVWQHVNQVNRLLIIWGNCVYCYTHIKCRVIIRKSTSHAEGIVYMETQNTE